MTRTVFLWEPPQLPPRARPADRQPDRCQYDFEHGHVEKGPRIPVCSDANSRPLRVWYCTVLHVVNLHLGSKTLATAYDPSEIHELLVAKCVGDTGQQEGGRRGHAAKEGRRSRGRLRAAGTQRGADPLCRARRSGASGASTRGRTCERNVPVTRWQMRKMCVWSAAKTCEW